MDLFLSFLPALILHCTEPAQIIPESNVTKPGYNCTVDLGYTTGHALNEYCSLSSEERGLFRSRIYTFTQHRFREPLCVNFE